MKYLPLINDSYGQIRWVLDYTTHPQLKNLDYDCSISRLKNGNFYFGDQATDKVYEVDLFGNNVNNWSMTGYKFHHDVYEKPDGNFIVSVDKPCSKNLNGIETVEDYIIEINRTSGNIINEWDLKESLDENRTALSTDTSDWMHVNAVMFDPSDETIIVSGRVQGVVKLPIIIR